MKNRYSKGAHISEARFREVIRFFAADLPSLTASELTSLNYRTVHRIYSLMRERLVELALQEMQPLAGDIEVDESYFGARRVRGKRGRGSGGKANRSALAKALPSFLRSLEKCRAFHLGDPLSFLKLKKAVMR